MTRATYLKTTTIAAGVLTAAGTVFWYTGAPVLQIGGAGIPVDALLLLPATLIAGADIARRGLAALRRRHLGIELVVTLATLGALVLGEYFEAAAVTVLFALGGMLENRAMRRTREALRIIRQNLGIAVATVVVLLSGVLLGQVHTAGGTLIHQGSSLLVIANGLRLRRWCR